MVESDTARVSVLPVAGCKFPAFFGGKVTLDVVGLGVGPAVSLSGFGGNPAGFDRRASRDESYSSGCNPGWWICRGGASPGTDRAFGSGKAPGWLSARADACAGTIRAFGSEKSSGRWITGGKIGRGLVCTTHHGTDRACGSGDSFSMGAIGTFELRCD